MEQPPSLSERIGRALFATRSFTPVPVVAAAIAVLFLQRDSPGLTDGVDWTLDALGLSIAFLGQGLRFWVLGQVPPRTSGQGNVLEAATLNTRGPYAFVRNPLYLGNFFIVAGLLVIAANVWVVVLGLGFFAAQYVFIVRAEEAFLRERFGADFVAWCRKVPRWIPRLSPASTEPLATAFDRRRAVFKEHNPFAAWASAAIGLLLWKSWLRGGTGIGTELRVYVSLEVVVLAGFVVVKGWKHGWVTRGVK